MEYSESIIHTLDFTGKFEKEKIDFLIKLAEVVHRKSGEIVTKQFEQGHSFYFLLDGSVNFSISLEDKGQELSVGRSDKQFTPIGWSGFRQPKRYATTVRTYKDSVLLKWNHQNLEKFFKQEPSLGREFILFVIKQSVDLLYQVCKELVRYENTNIDIDYGKTSGSFAERENIIVPGSKELIQKSSFFEIFPEKLIKKLSRITVKKWYLSGDHVFDQGDETEGIDVLAYGKVALFFKDSTSKSLDDSAILGIVSRPGTIIGWRGLCPSLLNETTAIATKDTVVYHISKKNLNKIISSDPELGFTFAKRLLWLVSIRLRNARAGLISRSYEREIISINNIIDQNSTQLSVNSPLHKLPHLLDNILTLGDAFNLLFDLSKNGNSLEQDLSVLCLDILGKVYREHVFYEGLKHIYQAVTEAPESLNSSEVRIQADRQFVGVFDKVPHVIEGWENLPDKPGHIFVYNHLLNHSYNTLPNDFQITLDSHFISSMILYRKYGEPSIRVVRVPRAEEYGHENYYERLGHINVYTKESEVINETEEQKKHRRENFFELAAGYVRSGTNIILSPEGTSFSTEESPGPFKPGAFLLARAIDPEPYIIPISIANFDKRVNQNVLAVSIKKPFLLSDYVDKENFSKESLSNFILNFNEQFRTYVLETINLAKESEKSKINIKLFEKVKKLDQLVINKDIFESDIKVLEKKNIGKNHGCTIMYGSSTFRLWKNVKKIFPKYNILNFGFGGARIDYCTYYFERLIKPNKIDTLIFYAGDNDVGDGRLPKQLFNSFLIFYNKFREYFPDTKFSFVSIKPSPSRFMFKERIEATNDLIKQFLMSEENTFYLNIYDHMLEDDGYVDGTLFTEDRLHMNKNGYKVWEEVFSQNEKELFGY